ncbi:MAG: hypothetical protein KBI19_07010, partial [Candidatus Cloacimonas sp.]|nr:hypothetical protein [Candidatus Cloacimonas sp.]
FGCCAFPGSSRTVNGNNNLSLWQYFSPLAPFFNFLQYRQPFFHSIISDFYSLFIYIQTINPYKT